MPGSYPPDWPEIAERIKRAARWRCATAHSTRWFVLSRHIFMTRERRCDRAGSAASQISSGTKRQSVRWFS